jgi:hypothetical protein
MEGTEAAWGVHVNPPTRGRTEVTLCKGKGEEPSDKALDLVLGSRSNSRQILSCARQI